MALVIVAPQQRKELLRDPGQMWLSDFVSVQQPTPEEMQQLIKFLSDDYPDAPQKCYWPSAHTKIGHDETGLYIHGQHNRRHVAVRSTYFDGGAPAATSPSAPVAAEEATASSETSQKLRDELMTQTFKVADKNGDGVVSKNELRLLLRRVVPGMQNDEADAIFRDIDKDGNSSITNGEFVSWMRTNQAGGVCDALERTVTGHRHFIQAAFRLWDTNGDGCITRTELQLALKQICPNIETAQLELLFSRMDADHSEQVDYTEFVNFLWDAK